jgi:predicted DsbA family dithiol-disulfide isomerase
VTEPVTTSTAPDSTVTAPTQSAPIKVDIWSDVQCPWCYIGKRKFEAAVDGFDGEVEVEYHSFELAPDTPVDYDGTPSDYLAAKYNIGPEQVQAMHDRVSGIASTLGLEYDFEHMHQTNTIKAHELLHYAKAHGKQLELKERLLQAYFLNGEHVGRIPDLAEIAASIGFDREDVVRALESEQYLPDVKADMAQARAYGINGVPFYVVDGKYGVSGAQETATFANVLEQARAEKDV